MNSKPSIMERRRFMKLLAASGAAVLAGAAPRARAKPAPPSRAHPKALPAVPAVEKEIRSQKKSLAETLKVIREYELPPGSPPAVVFQAMRARSKR